MKELEFKKEIEELLKKYKFLTDNIYNKIEIYIESNRPTDIYINYKSDYDNSTK